MNRLVAWLSVWIFCWISDRYSNKIFIFINLGHVQLSHHCSNWIDCGICHMLNLWWSLFCSKHLFCFQFQHANCDKLNKSSEILVLTHFDWVVFIYLVYHNSMKHVDQCNQTRRNHFEGYKEYPCALWVTMCNQEPVVPDVPQHLRWWYYWWFLVARIDFNATVAAFHMQMVKFNMDWIYTDS